MSCRPVKYPLLCGVCVMFGLLGTLYAQQTGDKIIRAIQATQITDAVLISNVAVAGKTVECGLFTKPPLVIQPVTRFQAGPEWLRQMTISLVNRTNKTIVYGDLHLHFLDTGDCRSVPCVGVSLRLGQMPAVDAYEGRTGRPLKPENPGRSPLEWKSEQTIVVHVSDFIDEIQRNLADFMPAADVTKVNLYAGSFFFADGMRWEGSGDRYALPDPEHPGRFKDLPVDYFPGRRGNNWPPGYSQ